MRISFKDFLRHGGDGQYVLTRKDGQTFGHRSAPSLKSTVSNYDDLRSAFAASLDQVIAVNTRRILNALTPPDTVARVTEADLRDVSDAKDAALRAWEARLGAIEIEYLTHPQRIRTLRGAMEERLLRAFAGLINQLRQADLGIESYVWRTRDDGKVRSTHAANAVRVFRWDDPPFTGHPGHDHNCRCVAEPIWPGLPAQVVLADVPAATLNDLAALSPAVRQVLGRFTAVTPYGATALAALEASNLLQDFTARANEARILSRADILGVDATSVEGRLAAYVYSKVEALVADGSRAFDVPKLRVAAQIAGQAAGLLELLQPGTFASAAQGDPEAFAALKTFVESAYRAYEADRLRPQDGTLAAGWVEEFPDLTEDERRLGDLPGFTPERVDAFHESYAPEGPGLPPHTGTPIREDIAPPIISTPIPEEEGPNIVEARRDETFTTPGGNTIGDHGGKGDGLEYITGKGYRAEDIDDIIANPRPELSGIVAGRGRYKGQDMTLLTGQDGYWILLSPEGRVVAVSNRNRPLWERENEPDPIIRPLE